jgi:hypothetical protein
VDQAAPKPRGDDVIRSILSPTTVLGLLVSLTGNIIAWADGADIGAFVTAITVMATAVIGAIVMAYDRITRARISAIAAYEEAFAKSLKGQVARLKHDLAEERADAKEREDLLHLIRQELSNVIADRNFIRDELIQSRAEREALREEIKQTRHGLRNELQIDRNSIAIIEHKARVAEGKAQVAEVKAIEAQARTDSVELKIDTVKKALKDQNIIDADSDDRDPPRADG